MAIKIANINSMRKSKPPPPRGRNQLGSVDHTLASPAMLPDSCLVPFPAYRMENLRVFWRSLAVAPQIDLGLYNFCTDKKASTHPHEIATFQAERYGGNGVGFNAGGARCGLRNNLQVKGIGTNPLLSEFTDRAHRSGEVTLKEAIREVIWGEVYSMALPYGAVRAVAILGTGTQTVYREAARADGYSPRVVLVREAALRPAHFMRATNRSHHEDSQAKLSTDTERTIAAIQRISSAFIGIFGTCDPKLSQPKFINASLLKCVMRIAAQIAAAHVKRIPHGQLNCSNIALDGRYIDFWTATAISDYGRIIITKGCPDLWNTQISFKSTITNLLFYLRNYLPSTTGSELIQAETLWHQFQRFYRSRLHTEFLKLSGIPESWFASNDFKEIDQLRNCIAKIISTGTSEPFRLRDMPLRMGKYHLNTIFLSTYACWSHKDIYLRLEEQIPDKSLRETFSRSLSSIRENFFNTIPRDHISHSKLFVTVNCLRKNLEFPELYRGNLELDIINTLYGSEVNTTITSYIEKILLKARTLLAQDEKEIEAEWLFGEKLSLTCQSIIDSSGQRLDPQDLLAFSSHLQVRNIDSTGFDILCRTKY